jgi:hypothetical protein
MSGRAEKENKEPREDALMEYPDPFLGSVKQAAFVEQAPFARGRH